MASMTLTTSCLPSIAAKPLSNAVSDRGSLMVVRASMGYENTTVGYRVKESTVKQEQKGITMRRDLIFAAAAAAAATLTKAAIAEDEPKRGTEEAKKKYAPICVTMPTARICHK